MKRVSKEAVIKASTETTEVSFKPPVLMAGVVPKGKVAPVMAKDNACYNPIYMGQMTGFTPFPGFQYLSQLATRAEFRAMSGSIAHEITRKWIELSGEGDDPATSDKILQITTELERINLREVIKAAAEHDGLFGRAQIYIDLGVEGEDRKLPLVLSNKTIKKGSLKGVTTVEAVWTTPAAYNAVDPIAADFYRPTHWYMLGQEVHASRLITVVTRPLPDILKPAYNFAGISLSQLAEPYVDNWLRTRQSVSDLINNFSTTALKTAMDQVLTGDDDGAGLLTRAQLFTAHRSNKGLMLLDMEREDLVQQNVPLGGLHELQAQSQEHMCSVSRIPAIVLTGISPSGLNASSDGEIRIFYDWINGQQESHWRDVIETILKVVQLSLFGDIDPNIKLKFKPLYQMTPTELAAIRLQNAQAASASIADGVIDPSEERQRLASDPDSGYHGLDMDQVIIEPNGDVTGDKSVSEAQHRAW